jgi:hypothetical protein
MAAEEPDPTPRENAVRLRAKRMIGSEVDVVPRFLRTRAGKNLTGILVYGYLVVRDAGGPDAAPRREVLGMSPPLGNRLDLGWLGTPEEALADALQRKADRLGPYPPGECDTAPPEVLKGEGRRPTEPRPFWRPSATGTTSSIELPTG